MCSIFSLSEGEEAADESERVDSGGNKQKGRNDLAKVRKRGVKVRIDFTLSPEPLAVTLAHQWSRSSSLNEAGKWEKEKLQLTIPHIYTSKQGTY